MISALGYIVDDESEIRVSVPAEQDLKEKKESCLC
jgi:hypothetical protein